MCVTRELRERPAERVFAVLIDLADCDAIDFLRRETRLVALLRRALQPRAAAIHAAVDAPAAGQLPVDVHHHARIASPWAQFIGGDQVLDGCFQKADLGLQQEIEEAAIGLSLKVVSSVRRFEVYNVMGYCQVGGAERVLMVDRGMPGVFFA